jgi:membrane-associated phospholipid phosphatase
MAPSLFVGCLPSSVGNAARPSGPRSTGTWKIICALSLIAFAVLAAYAHQRPYFGWDLAVAARLQRLPGLLPIMKLVSIPGYGWWPFALTAATALIFLAAGRRTESAFLILSTAVAGLLNHVAKEMVGRPRPPENLVAVSRALGDPSFPSGHVMFYCSYFGFLLYLAHRERSRSGRWRHGAIILAAVPIALVGPSRVYLGEHWPSDVLGAYLLAGAWLAVVVHAYSRWKAHSADPVASQRGIAPR